MRLGFLGEIRRDWVWVSWHVKAGLGKFGFGMVWVSRFPRRGELWCGEVGIGKVRVSWLVAVRLGMHGYGEAW